MHILAFLLLFVVGAILAACNGDYSGIAAIGKFVGGCVVISGGMVIYAACFAGNCYCNTYSDCDMLFGKIGWIDNCDINKEAELYE